MVFLADQEVTLRPVCRDDRDNFVRWLNDPETRRYLKTFLPITPMSEEAWIDKLKDDVHNIVLVIEVSGKPIGIIGLHRINWKDRRATTGTVIGDAEFRGRRIGRRAKNLLLRYAFHDLGLNKIDSSVIAFNERSLRYSLACGYKREGRRRQHILREGKFWDEILLGITRSDWERFQKQSVAK